MKFSDTPAQPPTSHYRALKMRDTPRTDALETETQCCNVETREEIAWRHARDLERDLETVRDAHMANCLASDTLRAEIKALREALSSHEHSR